MDTTKKRKLLQVVMAVALAASSSYVNANGGGDYITLIEMGDLHGTLDVDALKAQGAEAIIAALAHD